MLIKRKIIILNFILISFILGISLENLRVAREIIYIDGDSKKVGKAKLRQLDSDLTHDMIFNRTGRIVLLYNNNDLIAVEKILLNLNELTSKILNSVKDNLAMGMPDKSEQLYKILLNDIQEYISRSNNLIAAARNKSQNIKQLEERFAAQYSIVDETLKKTNFEITAWDEENHKISLKTLSTFQSETYIISLILLSIIGFSINRTFIWIFNPQAEIMKSMDSLSKGNLDITIPYLNKEDEMGQMAKALEIFRNNALQIQKMNEEKKSFEANAEIDRKKVLSDLANKFNSTVTQVSTTVGLAAEEMEATSKNMADSSKANSSRVTDLVQYASTASTNVSTVASAAEELSASVKELERQIGESTNNVNGAVKQAEIATTTISGLSTATEKISHVTSLITDIAAQVNILALNATIEASRAGEAGKGFGVVALEVKGLALQTTKALEQITEQINAIKAESSNAVNFIEGISKTINEISRISSSISHTIQDQGIATTEIAKNITQAAKWVEDLYKNSEGVKAFTDQNMNSANEMLKACGELSSQAGVLNNEVSKFVKGIL
jgi:methyl-accepting chemotaxis protein